MGLNTSNAWTNNPAYSPNIPGGAGGSTVKKLRKSRLHSPVRHSRLLQGAAHTTAPRYAPGQRAGRRYSILFLLLLSRPLRLLKQAHISGKLQLFLGLRHVVFFIYTARLAAVAANLRVRLSGGSLPAGTASISAHWAFFELGSAP